MTATIDRWDPANASVVSKSGFRYLDTTPIVTSTRDLEYSDATDLFEQFHRMNNALRYCNGSRFTFQDKSLEARYRAWLGSDDFRGKSFELHYGNGVVD